VVVERVPDGHVVKRVPPNDQFGHALDQRLGCERGLGPHGDGLTPADDTILGGDPDEAEVTQSIDIVGLWIGDRDGLECCDPVHCDRPSSRSRCVPGGQSTLSSGNRPQSQEVAPWRSRAWTLDTRVTTA
jgi:hypothetical protein